MATQLPEDRYSCTLCASIWRHRSMWSLSGEKRQPILVDRPGPGKQRPWKNHSCKVKKRDQKLSGLLQIFPNPSRSKLIQGFKDWACLRWFVWFLFSDWSHMTPWLVPKPNPKQGHTDIPDTLDKAVNKQLWRLQRTQHQEKFFWPSL